MPQPGDEKEPSFQWRDLLELGKGLAITLGHLLRKKPFTLEYPEQKLPVRPGYHGEHRLKMDTQGRPKCVACFMCAAACPAECIHIVAAPAPWDDREKYPEKFDIDMLRCIYCGFCEEACPCDAIELTTKYNQIGTSRKELIYDKEKLLKN